MALIEADGATYAAAVKELVHNTQDSLRSLGIAGADREAIRGAIERSLGGEPTPAEVHRAAMACNNAGCLQVRKGNAKEAVFHFRKIVILSRFVAVRLANPKSITISANQSALRARIQAAERRLLAASADGEAQPVSVPR